jgi:hypothetical protein
MDTRQFKISNTYTSSRRIGRKSIAFFCYCFFGEIYLSRNVKIRARKRKPLKLQTSMTARIVVFDEGLIFNVDEV